MLRGITWLGHASFEVRDKARRIYIDPWKLSNPQPADLVLVTHGHRDHLSPEDLARVCSQDTTVVCPQGCEAQVADLECQVRTVKPGETLEVLGYPMEVVYSYNTNKPNHPRGDQHVGYVIEVGGRRIYHAGDTDLIPEMADIRCDVALLPIGGTYTMDADEWLEAIARIRPKVVVPMHWGDIVGGPEDAERVRDGAPEGVEVAILTAGG